MRKRSRKAPPVEIGAGQSASGGSAGRHGGIFGAFRQERAARIRVERFFELARHQSTLENGRIWRFGVEIGLLDNPIEVQIEGPKTVDRKHSLPLECALALWSTLLLRRLLPAQYTAPADAKD